MPNWCECTLKIIGDPNDVRDCLASIATPASESDDQRLFDFERVIPLPPNPLERLGVPDTFRDGILRPEVAENPVVGTKWNAYRVTIESHHESGEADIQFGTSWAPPRPIIVALADASRASSSTSPTTTSRRRSLVVPGAPGEPWVTIDARYEYGFCQTAVEARSMGLEELA
jgi:hypothetical protein